MKDPNGNDTRDTGSTVLDTLSKVDPFVVAPGFFDRFPHEVQALAVHRSKRSLWPTWRTASISLGTACMIGISTWLFWPDGPNEPPLAATTTITPLTNEELEVLDDGELLAIAEEVEPAAAVQEFGQVHLDLNESELIAFLEHENTDINELLDYQ